MPSIDAQARVVDVARMWPETMPIFARYRLDLCCGGGHTLEFVAQKHNLDLQRLVDELNHAATAHTPPNVVETKA